jgi:hypothetical protein
MRCMYRHPVESQVGLRIKCLLKAMHGLIQAHKAWHATISGDLMPMGFSELKRVLSVFIKWFGTRAIVLMQVYVDALAMPSPSRVYLEDIN